MSSIIAGYNYDIFISYRQKDNKYDGWVTEFVDNLKRELEATFKEEISVYFDINPHDGLLETHYVDASLQEKLKSLIFIPIISRTYCDPKSFAWEHEFKAFVEQASIDQFGLKAKLPNGNVACRVLPIRIHDLDNNDMRLCESVLAGFIRGIEFIYKSPGVNRPLRSKEDKPHENLNNTIYRDQINKVALAVKDIIESMKISVSPEQAKHAGVQLKKENKNEEENRIEETDRKEIVKLKKRIWNKKIRPEKEKGFPLLLKQGILIPGIVLTIAIMGALIFLLSRHSKIKWAKEKALPEIERLHNEDNQIQAFNLVQKAGKYISKEPEFRRLSSLVTSYITIITDPPGADVYIREYSDIKGEWKRLGTTPIDSIKFPGASLSSMTRLFYMMRIEKPGYDNILAVASNIQDTLYRKLFKHGTIPPGMMYVEGFKEEVKNDFDKGKHGFFIDRYEVTNRQYKEFVDSGGYRNPKYWKNEFRKDGKIITWNEAMTYFTDNTGRPGPVTWEAGDYPDGKGDYPVSGISWYEAAAYAEYAGKSLPTEEHWYSATGYYYYFIQKGKSLIFLSKIIPISNFNHKGTEPVGKYQGITWFGAFDMAGNVREWCWNETPVGHVIWGGAWNDESYSYYEVSQLPSWDRSPKNGFRCVKYIEKEKIPEVAFQPVNYDKKKDYSGKEPVSEEIFKIYRNQFLYDSTDLKAVIEDRINNSEEWTAEKISFNAAYGKERMIAYLFLPKNSSPPFQTIIFFPGLFSTREKDLIGSPERKWFTDYLLKSGRAVMFPVYKCTFERSDEPMVYGGHKFTEGSIKWVKDFKRSVDYLETRSDIDKRNLGFYGYSWGGYMGGIIPAVENRLKVNILIVGGFYPLALPEANGINYVPRIKIPTLMLAGRYDYTNPLEINVRPFYRLLGTPENDKHLIIYETDHYVLKNDMIKEVLGFLDKYFGPIKNL